MQKRRNSSTLAVELRLFGIKPSIYCEYKLLIHVMPSLECCLKYHVTLDRVITAPDCTLQYMYRADPLQQSRQLVGTIKII